MADLEFEEFRNCLEELPQHIKSSARSYKLVHDIVVDEEGLTNSASFVRSKKEDAIICNANNAFDNHFRNYSEEGKTCLKRSHQHLKTKNAIEKRRHKLLQLQSTNRIVVHDKNLQNDFNTNGCSRSLFDEIQRVVGDDSMSVILNHRMMSSCLSNTLSPSPDSELCDSGNSTVHSPDDSLIVGFTNNSASRSCCIQLELLEATHRALHKFIARHSDELELEIGDPIYVQKEAEDLWCEGINLRNGNRGIFPSAYVVDMEYNDFDSSILPTKRERFLLTYLGSVETLYHKGNSVLCQALHKITSTKHEYHSCILEVSDQGLKMYDRLKPRQDNMTTLDYFYSLKNVSFCGFHPQDSRFMGFITKHPQYDKFACHVFQGDESTRPITECIGRAFQRFYEKYIENAYPIEDIYIE